MFFLTGDELGNIKGLRVSPGIVPSELTVLDSAKSAVAALSIASTASTSKSVAAAYADGSIAAFSLKENQLQSLHRWKETRYRPDQGFIGLQATQKGVYSCTSNGALRLLPLNSDEKKPILGSLPARLCDWRLASDQTTFAYGGDEVELSVWDTEQALASDRATSLDASGTKRKRDALFPGEIWRAKNVQNDGLDLRQPVRINSLVYLPTSTSTRHHLVTGTQFGDVRRYDTRARRPVSNWKGIGKMGGVKLLEKGFDEHELFVSDHGCNLFSLDLRNGRVLYSYKGLSGAVTSMAPSPSLLVSTALDRYSRIHTSHSPPLEAGQNQDNKGQVVEKVFMASVPTVVVWDGVETTPPALEIEAEEDDVWDDMENVEEDTDEFKRKKRRRNAE
ncbi:WD40-repeat-containing domain protein [Mycena crocata]|nr:WD40-repeat-containing domain protein [Mycena crocata]